MAENKNKSVFKKNIILIILILLIGVVPLLLVKSEFGGSDDKGEEVIKTIKPNYEPWAKNLIELPGDETESLLFALQAAIGAGVVGLGATGASCLTGCDGGRICFRIFQR